MAPIEANDVCLFCQRDNWQHASDCAAQYDKTKLLFPDAPPTAEGQAAAAHLLREDVKHRAELILGNLRVAWGTSFVEAIELAVLVATGKAALVQLLRFQELIKQGAYTTEKFGM